MFDEFIDNNKENIINSICDLIKYPSVSEENYSEEAPFGEECKKALEYTLDLGKKMGFRTKNIDGYCGYIEFGEGAELVGIIGHLDVVPALKEDGWTSPPFSPVVRGNKIFGRGTIDDKGPVISALYAMKAVANNSKVSKRVRLILGLNEEKSWKCIDYYKRMEEHPSTGFSPDANFPAIYAEKGIMSVVLKHKFAIENMTILEIDCNNNALNIVPKYCSITLKYNTKDNRREFNSLYDMDFNRKIEVQKVDEDTIKIISYGTAAHAAHPELGINAITNLVYYLAVYDNNIQSIPEYEFLRKSYFLGLFDTESPEFLSRDDIAYPTEFEENTIIQDESGILTSNIAVLEYDENNNIIIKINLRVPVETSLKEIKLKYRKLVNIYENLEIDFINEQPSLYIEKDSDLVKTLVGIFNKKTGMNLVPIPIGGGTYARAFDNFISYGPTMPGDADMCHKVDEYIDIDKLMLATKIYAEAIYELSK